MLILAGVASPSSRSLASQNWIPLDEAVVTRMVFQCSCQSLLGLLVRAEVTVSHRKQMRRFKVSRGGIQSANKKGDCFRPLLQMSVATPDRCIDKKIVS